MEYIKKSLAAYNVHIIKTKSFKTVTIEINFLRKIEKNEITIRNFLSDILLQSSKSYKTKRLLTIQSIDLYDANINSSSTRIGNLTNLSFSLKFLNEKYTEKGMYEKSLKFLFDTLFNPNVEDNRFDKTSFEMSKEHIKHEIKSIKDNMVKYSLIKMLESMGNGYPYSYIGYGYMEDLENINSENLYEYYKDVLRRDKVDIFVIGDIDVDETLNIIKDNFEVNTVKKELDYPIIKHEKIRGRLSKVCEKENIIQAKLSIGCKLKDLDNFESKYVLPIYNEILGGSTESKLFLNVREKHSLAYYINSVSKIYDNILMIYCGIDSINFDKTLDLIKKEMLNMKKGIFEDIDLENAKTNMITSVNTITDSPSRIISLYYSKELINSDDIDKKIEQIKKVSKDDIINVANKIKIDTVHLLYGDGKHEKN